MVQNLLGQRIVAAIVAAITWQAVGLAGPPFQAGVIRTAAAATDSTNAPRQPFAAPMVGYIQTSPGELRAVLGVAGATQLGERLALPPGVGRLFVAPRQDYALFAIEGGAALGLATLSGESMGAPILMDGAAASSAISFSPNGRSAGVVSDGHMQVWTGLPGTVRLAFELTLPEGAADFSVNDAGTLALFQEAGGRVLLASEGEAPELVWSDAGVAVTAFLPGCDCAAAYGTAAHQLVLLRGLGADFSTQVLADALEGITGDALLTVSGNGSHVFLAGAGQQQIAKIPIDGSGLQWIASSAAITRMSGLLATDQVLVSAEDGKSPWILDSSDGHVRVYFVPRVVAADGDAR